jgi:hypothetical protein
VITVKRKASQLRRPAPSKDDRETVVPPLVWVNPVRTPDAGSSAPKPSAKATERSHAVTAFDAMCAARPLAPPPLPKHNDTRTAGACALAKEIRLGDYEP